MKSIVGVIIIPVCLFLSLTVYGQEKGSFLMLENGEKLYGKVELKTPFMSKTYFMYNDSIKYKMTEVASYQNKDGYFVRYRNYSDSFFGGSMDLLAGARFVRRTVAGRISLFEESGMRFAPAAPIPGGPMGGNSFGARPMFESYTLDYFSKDDGEIKEVTLSNFEEAMKDNKACMKLLSDYTALRTVSWGLTISGAGLAIAGVATSSKETGFNTGLVVGGAVVALLSYILKWMGDAKLENAVKTYNKE